MREQVECEIALLLSNVIFVEKENTMDRLQDRFSKLLQEVSTDFHRYMYHQINWNNRMIGLTGPRGVGKTMLILQYLKENLPRENSLYVTAEDFYFVEHLFVGFGGPFCKTGRKASVY